MVASLQAAVFILGMALVFVLERLWPLREATQPKLRRVARNLAIAGSAGVITRFTILPAVFALVEWTRREGWDWSPLARAPDPWRFVLTFLALDYTLYVWHRMNHRISFLWRFHQVHHADLDMDASTAVRFHFLELLLSGVFQAAQVLLLCPDWATIVAFQASVVGFAIFHHGDFAMPLAWERRLNRFLVTPRMHEVHHSIHRGERDSNWSTIFSFWDRLHRTALGVSRQEFGALRARIGLAELRDPRQVTFLKSLALPFRRGRPLQ